MFPERTLQRPTDLRFVDDEGDWDLSLIEVDDD